MEFNEIESVLQGLLWLLLLLLWTLAIPQIMRGNDDRRMARLEKKVDVLLDHFGLADQFRVPANDQILQLLQEGRKIEAIKVYRETTGAGLKEAKEAVEEMQRQGIA